MRSITEKKGTTISLVEDRYEIEAEGTLMNRLINYYFIGLLSHYYIRINNQPPSL